MKSLVIKAKELLKTHSKERAIVLMTKAKNTRTTLSDIYKAVEEASKL